VGTLKVVGDAQAQIDRSRDRRLARQLELLVDTVTDYAIFLLDTEGYVQTWNPGAERIKGYSAEDIIGRHFREFYPDEERARRKPEEELRIARRDGRYQEEGWRIRKDGSRFWASVVITAIRDEHGTLVAFGKVTRDLTSRRLAEDQLRLAVAELRTANEELLQFRRMVAGVRDYAIFMLDAGGYVKTWNAGAENIKGYTAEDIIGRHFSTFYTAPDRERGHPANELVIAAREGRYAEEGWRLRKDGSRFWASVTITAIRNDHGVLVGFAKLTRDLTERRMAEEELRAAYGRLEAANAELERFAAVAAHDLREPLGTLAGFADLLCDREAERLSDDGREWLAHISGSAARMHDLVEELLAYARSQEQIEAAPVDLRASLDRVLGTLRRTIAARGASVDVDVPDGATVLADETGVDTLLQNLISNAVKFGASDGPHVVVAAGRDDGGWRVSVSDDGPGIDAADRERIFGAFERLPAAARVPGSGLGLAICSHVVRRAGGELGVDSTPGRGSSFWFVLPTPASAG
jgi:PAS domain S-box-containing protein